MPVNGKPQHKVHDILLVFVIFGVASPLVIGETTLNKNHKVEQRRVNHLKKCRHDLVLRFCVALSLILASFTNLNFHSLSSQKDRNNWHKPFAWILGFQVEKT